MSVNKRRWLRGKQIYKLTSQPHLFEIGTSIDNKLQICQSLILDGAGQVVLVRWNLQGPQRRPLCRLNFQFHHFLIVSHRDNKIWEGGEENSMSTRLHRKSHCSSWIWPWRGDKIKKFFLMKNFQEDTESDLVAKKNRDVVMCQKVRIICWVKTFPEERKCGFVVKLGIICWPTCKSDNGGIAVSPNTSPVDETFLENLPKQEYTEC